MIHDAFVVGENHGCPHVSGEHFVDGRPTPLVVVLSQGDLNCTEQVVGEYRDEEVRGGSPRQLVINRSKSEIAFEGPKGFFDFGEGHVDVPDLRGR